MKSLQCRGALCAVKSYSLICGQDFGPIFFSNSITVSCSCVSTLSCCMSFAGQLRGCTLALDWRMAWASRETRAFYDSVRWLGTGITSSSSARTILLDVSITGIGSRLQRPVDDVLHPLSLAALLVLQGVTWRRCTERSNLNSSGQQTCAQYTNRLAVLSQV